MKKNNSSYEPDVFFDGTVILISFLFRSFREGIKEIHKKDTDFYLFHSSILSLILLFTQFKWHLNPLLWFSFDSASNTFYQHLISLHWVSHFLFVSIAYILSSNLDLRFFDPEGKKRISKGHGSDFQWKCKRRPYRYRRGEYFPREKEAFH